MSSISSISESKRASYLKIHVLQLIWRCHLQNPKYQFVIPRFGNRRFASKAVQSRTGCRRRRPLVASGAPTRGQISTPTTCVPQHMSSECHRERTDCAVWIVFCKIIHPVSRSKPTLKHRLRFFDEAGVQGVVPILVYHLQHLMLISQPCLFFLQGTSQLEPEQPRDAYRLTRSMGAKYVSCLKE